MQASRRRFLLALGGSLLFAFAGTWGPPLTAPDEIRVAETAREMRTTGDWIVPRLGGEAFLEEPPLHYAVVAASLRIFGTNEGAARLPSALATVITLLLAFDMARRLAAAGATASPGTTDGDGPGSLTGLLAIAVLASISGFYRYSHRCMVDASLSMSVTLGFWAWLRLLLQPAAPANEPAASAESAPRPSAAPGGPPHPGLLMVLYAAATLAFLVKGPVGVALLAGPVLIDLLVRRRWWLLRSRAHAAGVLLLLACTALWPLLLWLHGGKALLDTYLRDNVFQRVVPDGDYKGGHVNPPWYYLLHAPTFLLPWVLGLPGLALWLWRSRRSRPTQATPPAVSPGRDALVSVALVFPVGLVLLSIPGTKRPLYLMPLLAPLAVVLAVWLVSTVARGRRSGPSVAGALFALAVAGQLCAPLVADPSRDLGPMATGLRDGHLLDDALVGWRLRERVRAVVPWYSGQIVDDLQEPDALRVFATDHPDGRVLVEDRRIGSLPPDIAARLQPQRHWTFGDDGYSLLTLRPSDPATGQLAKEEKS